MSRPPLAGCLVLCLLSFAPPSTTRAEDGGPSPRRKAEIEALIAKRRTDKQKRARVAAIHDAEVARRLSEARAYEVNMAHAIATYQASLERRSMMQGYWLERANRSTSPQPVTVLPPITAGPGIPAFTSGPVFVKIELPRPASEAGHGSPAHPGSTVQVGPPAHGTPHARTPEHHGHAR